MGLGRNTVASAQYCCIRVRCDEQRRGTSIIGGLIGAWGTGIFSKKVAVLSVGVGLSSGAFGLSAAILIGLAPSPTSDDFGPIGLAIFYFVLGFVVWLPISLLQGATTFLVLRLIREDPLRLVLVFIVTSGISSLILLIGLRELGLGPAWVLSWAAVVALSNAVSWAYIADRYLKVSI